MPEVNVSVGGRAYRMACGEGEEEHLQALARSVDGRIAAMRRQLGEIGDQRLAVMVAITLADELSEAQARVKALEGQSTAGRHGRDEAAEAVAAKIAAALDEAAAAVDGIARSLNGEAAAD